MNSRRFIETPRGRPGGPDGHLHFRDADKKPQFAVVSVKGGGIKSGDPRLEGHDGTREGRARTVPHA
jgi:hypothetical protein